jgi:hypothetical protein
MQRPIVLSPQGYLKSPHGEKSMVVVGMGRGAIQERLGHILDGIQFRLLETIHGRIQQITYDLKAL